jgi:hypothetical protein
MIFLWFFHFLQAEICRLTDALEKEKKRGFWSGLFRRRSG